MFLKMDLICERCIKDSFLESLKATMFSLLQLEIRKLDRLEVMSSKVTFLDLNICVGPACSPLAEDKTAVMSSDGRNKGKESEAKLK